MICIIRPPLQFSGPEGLVVWYDESIASPSPLHDVCVYRRGKLERGILDQRVRLPQVDALRWRVDVTISNR